MEEFFHILLHSLIDTAKLIPTFLIVYLLIEFLEYKEVFAFEKSKLLKGKASPVMGSLVGSIPQCGFSVISAELFSKKKISIGALVSVFIATSDEALPIMFANINSISSLLNLLSLILAKIIFACIIGYIVMFLYTKVFKLKNNNTNEYLEDLHIQNEHLDDEHHHVQACCHHDFDHKKFHWKHPIIHCIKISLYIFIFNLIFGAIIELVGEESLTQFLSSNNVLQPIFAVLIGLIPNCASSVALTNLFLLDGLSFGSIVAGLSTNAGLGFIILFKENKNKKENLFIVLSITILSLAFGYILHFIPFNFL